MNGAAMLMDVLKEAPSDSDRQHLLQTLPAPPAVKVIMGLATFSPEADAFKMLKPYAKDMDLVQRNMFKEFAKMSDAEIEQEIKEDQATQRRGGTVITPDKDLLKFPPNERRRKFVAGLLTMAGMMEADGETFDFGDSDSDDDEFGFGFDSDGDSSDSSDSSGDVDPATLSPTEHHLSEPSQDWSWRDRGKPQEIAGRSRGRQTLP